MSNEVLLAYGLQPNSNIQQFGDGLINNTWKIDDKNGSFILQKINTSIFKNPEYISQNIQLVADYLAKNFPAYFFCTPIKTIDGKDLFYSEDKSCYRLYPFIKNSHTINVPDNANEAYEAARKFGELTKLLCAFPVYELKITLPDFHNILLRYKNFITATQKGNAERIDKAKSAINFLLEQKNIVDVYEQIIASHNLQLRVTHHDTKINNVLFDNNNKGICVIDLDTLMPGYFLSDVGDMMRTYISPAGEEEKDFSKLEMRTDYFTAIAKGYLNEMYAELNETELNHFVFAGKFMIYMQALRFLTDYLNNDIYYGRKYEDHNFIRASNQIHLLKLLIDKEEKFQSIIEDVVKEKFYQTKVSIIK